jgi:hypothetical protein
MNIPVQHSTNVIPRRAEGLSHSEGKSTIEFCYPNEMEMPFSRPWQNRQGRNIADDEMFFPIQRVSSRGAQTPRDLPYSDGVTLRAASANEVPDVGGC